MTLTYWEWHLIPRLRLRSIFAQFPEHAASQRLGILSNPWRVFHDWSLLGRCFRGFVLAILEYYCGARLQIHILNYWTVLSVHGASFLIAGVFECDIAHRRSMAVLCMLYKIRCNPMHPLYGALPAPWWPIVVMVEWLAEQTAVLSARVRTSLVTPDCRFSVQCKVIAQLGFYDAITGPIEFISTIVNSVKMVDTP